MNDPITGNTLRWTYLDGPTKGKTFEHSFAKDGTVTYRMVDGGELKAGATQREKKQPTQYKVEKIKDDVFVVSYLSPDSGYTLTSILDASAGTVVSFASNETNMVVQHGTFDHT
jgi:hypothetical protein